MDLSENDRYAFMAEWYDQQAALIRKYQLLFYVPDGTVEIYDIKNKRMFLKRTKVDGIRLEDFFIGSTLNIFSRQLKITDYGDEYTRKKVSSKKARTLGVIKPDGISKMGEILSLIAQYGLLITKLRMCKVSLEEAGRFYAEHQSKPFYNTLLNFITSGPILAMELMGENSVEAWCRLLGPTDSATARTEAPLSIRARFGTDITANAAHGSASPEAAAGELEFFFPTSGSRMGTATYQDCTCCVIKPHAVLEGLVGEITTAVLEAGFEISAAQLFNLERGTAEEFLEVYKGVVQEYTSMVTELTSGPCIAMEIRAQNAATKFREFCGPSDPEIARHLRPRTLRAKFGRNKLQNAVHCTDLPEDGVLEVEYFFRILDS